MITKRFRAGLGGVTLMAAAALVAGCASSGSGTSASSSAAPSTSASGSGSASSAAPASSPETAPTSKSSTATGLAACTTANLSVALVSNMGGGAAGSTYVPIQFTNTAGSACALYGFPGVSFVTGQGGSQIGAPAQRSPSAKVTVTLAAHATAHAWLQIAEAGNYPASSCHVTNASWLKIYPPGNTAAAYVSHSFQTCSSAKVVTMTIDPVRTGAAVQGQVP
ncbi:MAG TPA: DUF4232 domain-containing protein [Streptosporangiaceae bacterium]|nr:DUF4232 domain-containing protein [Streptosporangiaceae bacterium]